MIPCCVAKLCKCCWHQAVVRRLYDTFMFCPLSRVLSQSKRTETEDITAKSSARVRNVHHAQVSSIMSLSKVSIAEFMTKLPKFCKLGEPVNAEEVIGEDSKVVLDMQVETQSAIDDADTATAETNSEAANVEVAVQATSKAKLEADAASLPSQNRCFSKHVECLQRNSTSLNQMIWKRCL